MRRLVAAHRVAHVSTTNADGSRHTTPRASLQPWDGDRLVFVESHRGRALDNLERSSRVDVEVVDPLRGKGYRFSGRARVLRSGLLFDIVCAHQVDPELRRFVEAVVLVDVGIASPLIVPAAEPAETRVHRARVGA
jgi:uncharacterized protein